MYIEGIRGTHVVGVGTSIVDCVECIRGTHVVGVGTSIVRVY